MAARDIKIIDGQYSGKPPRPLRRIIDVLVGVCLMTAPLWAMFSYFRITVFAAGFGLVFIIVQKLINRGDPAAGSGIRRVSMGLRIFAGALLAAVVFTVFNLDSGMKMFYSLKKSVYCFADGIDSSLLDFMPDSIPDGSEKFYMKFIASSKEGTSGARIHFVADKDGVKKLREEALSKGGKLVEKDSFTHKKLRVYCEKIGETVSDSEVYAMGEADRQCPAYLINPDTGLCVIYW